MVTDVSTLELATRVFHAPDSTAAGASGIEELTFKALEKEEIQVYIEYSQLWDGGDKAVCTYEMMLIVE